MTKIIYIQKIGKYMVCRKEMLSVGNLDWVVHGIFDTRGEAEVAEDEIK